jgi:hypothetical protein
MQPASPCYSQRMTSSLSEYIVHECDDWRDGECSKCPPPMTPAEKLLTQIEAQCRIAREALADEHEADLRHAAVRIEYDAVKLLGLVTSW